MGSPILPRNIEDPTGQDSRERRAIADFKVRMHDIQRGMLRILDQQRYTVVTINSAELAVNETVYRFELDENILARINAEIAILINAILLEGGERSLWFMNAYVEPAYQQGTAQSMANLSVQSTEYALARPTLESVLLSDPYRKRIGLVRARVFEEMRGLSDAMRGDLGSTLARGMAAGQNPRVIAKDIKVRIDVSQSRANTIARTEITNALRQARMDETQDAQDRLGIRTMEMHISALSPTTRPTHSARHAHLYTIQEQKTWWARDANSINCYLPGTRVAGRFVAGSKARYDGPTVNLVAANGSNLTVTPNHPVMTLRGLIPAAEVCESDYLLAYGGNIELPVGPGTLDDKAGPAPIEQVFSALVQVGHANSSGVNAVDFHGDGEFIQGNVEVVRSERVLSCGADAKLGEILDSLALKHADAIICPGFGSLGFNFLGFDLSTPGSMSLGDVLGSFGGCHLCGTSECAISSGIDLESCLLEPSNNNRPRDSKSGGELKNGYSGHVEAVKVIKIGRGYFSGHVYDLEECSGLMVAENLIASNCKCSTVSVLVDEEGNPLTPSIIARAKAMRK